MQQWLTMLTATLAVFSVMGIGAAARWRNLLTQEADQTLLRLVIRVLVPALILDKILGNRALDDPLNVYIPPLVGYGSIILGVVIAMILVRTLGPAIGLTTRAGQRTFIVCVAMYNYGYIPIPLIQQLFDEDTVGVLFVHNLGVEMAMWTLCIFVLTGGMGRQWWKRLLNPPVITIVAALVINALGWHELIPAFVRQIFTMLGACAIPMSLLLIGATVMDYLGEARLERGMAVMGAGSLLRLMIIPALFVLFAWLMLGRMPVELQRVMVVQAAMPAATFPIVLAKHYQGDVATAVRVTLATSLLSLITMPLWLTYGLKWLSLG